MSRCLTIVWLIPALLYADCALAQIYKWVDEAGRVHFTDSPPADKGAAIEVRPPPVVAADEGEIRRLDLLRQAEVDAAQRKRWDSGQARQEAAVQNDRACNQARVHRHILAERMPVYWTADGALRAHWSNDTYRGERRYVADGQRPQVIAQVESDLLRYCDNPGDQAAMAAAYQDWLDQEWCNVYKVKLASAMDKKTRTPKDKVAEIQAQVRQMCR